MKINRRTVMGASAGFALIGGGAARAQVADDLGRRLDAYFAPCVARRDFSGVVYIRRKDAAPVTRVWGLADREGHRANSLETPFNVGSVAKLATYLAFRELRSKGALTANDPLSRFVPDFPRGKDITLAMLLQHTAGLRLDFSALSTFRMHPHTAAELAAAIARDPLIHAPGETFSYSNDGYRLLARVIEIAGGGDYHTVVRKLVLAPNGLNSTGPDFGPRVPKVIAIGFQAEATPLALTPAPRVNFSNWVGASSFYSTAADLDRLASLLPPPEPDKPGQPRSRTGHDGLVMGYGALCYRYAADDTRLIMLSNIESGLFDNLHGDLETMAFGGTVETPATPPEAPWPALARLKRLEGAYQIAPGVTLKVRAAPNRLTIDAGDGPTGLWPLGGDAFFSRLKYARLEFAGGAGPAGEVVWRQGGTVYHCARL